MKKTIRKVLNNNVISIKRLFNIMTAVAIIATAYNLFAIGGCPNGEEYRYGLQTLLSMFLVEASNILGAVVTRLLYFNGYLQRRNVIKFFSELH